MSVDARSSRLYQALLVLFFISGASSLMFETLWQRMMILVFGASAPATTAILIAFFIGLAGGSYHGGRLLGRFRNAMAFYALVELWIGAWSLAVPWLLGAMDVALKAFGDTNQITATAYLVRLGLSVAIVLPSTWGMGATIPVMNRLIHEFGEAIGKSAAVSYGVNTFGAVTGCLLTGFLLIRTVGVQRSLYAAAALNLTVVVSSLLLLRSVGAVSTAGAQRDEQADAATREAATPSYLPRVLLVLYFCAGFLALAYEVVWIRILSLHTSTSTTTFTIVLSVYLLGFSSGSLILFPILSRKLTGVRIFFLSNFLAGFAAIAAVPLYYKFTHLKYALVFPRGMESVTLFRLTLVEITFAFIMMFVPTVMMGLSFPAVCQALIERGREIGRKSGFYYFVGNLGSAAGVAAAGLMLIPALGLLHTLAALCIASVLIGATALVFLERGGRKTIIAASAAAFVVLVAMYSFYSAPFVRDGELKWIEGGWSYTPSGPGWHYASSIDISRILRYRSGPSATIIVKEERLREDPSSTFRALYVDDHHVASTRMYSVIDAKMLAHIPLMLHPDPKRALTVGFGSGGTSWSMSLHGVETTVVEIEPEVIRSAPFFESQNHNVLEAPNFHLILNDARNHLHVTDVRYDVISTDVTNLQYRQNGSLYTLEYFRLMKSRLTDNGIACAWIPMMAITDDEFRMLLRTFSAVFEHASFWYMDYSHTRFAILIGSPQPIRFDFDRIREMAQDPAIMEDLGAINLSHPMQIPLMMYMDERGFRDYVGDGPLHTDDLPHLEFSSAVSFYNFNIVEDFRNRLEGIRELRPKDYSPYLVNATDEERARFAQYEQLHRRWAEVIRLYYYDEEARLDPQRFKSQVTTKIDEVLAIDPDFEPAKALREKLPW